MNEWSDPVILWLARVLALVSTYWVIDDQENHFQTQDVVVILNKSQSHVIMALKRQYAIRVVYLSNLLIAVS